MNNHIDTSQVNQQVAYTQTFQHANNAVVKGRESVMLVSSGTYIVVIGASLFDQLNTKILGCMRQRKGLKLIPSTLQTKTITLGMHKESL